MGLDQGYSCSDIAALPWNPHLAPGVDVKNLGKADGPDGYRVVEAPSRHHLFGRRPKASEVRLLQVSQTRAHLRTSGKHGRVPGSRPRDQMERDDAWLLAKDRRPPAHGHLLLF